MQNIIAVATQKNLFIDDSSDTHVTIQNSPAIFTSIIQEDVGVFTVTTFNGEANVEVSEHGMSEGAVIAILKLI